MLTCMQYCGLGWQLTRACFRDKRMNKYVMLTHYAMLIEGALPWYPIICHSVMKDCCMSAPKQWPEQEFSVPNCLQLLGTSDLINGIATMQSQNMLVCHIILQVLGSCHQYFYIPTLQPLSVTLGNWWLRVA